MKVILGKQKKWRNCIILGSVLNEVENYCKDNGCDFANPTQFIGYAVRKELDFRKGIKSSKIFTEDQIKEKLDRWIDQVKQEMELDSRLEKVFRNSKTHAKTLSENI
ncbi:hypothetical protein [Nitrosopumilus ureiphilus]|uniref:Uncharacterized protein n=1 Tax=Nitrosopumilus ureiphilus TaxID=1470067 RepID=A0A7D5R319_9ARCH|nr:hypothetical protein [Nitrosopumilus ureiphilus]QLH06660.1 hypothetical protein C5F50_05910 [Nitrosopumilus ureiphilus]